jgi:superfamily II DNA/RNA helicase
LRTPFATAQSTERLTLPDPDIQKRMTFADLGLSPELLKAVDSAGYTTPTDIQAEAIPAILMMKDLIGIAQTGTGND